MKPEPCLLCVHLPHWPIDRLLRRQPALRHEPLVLIDTSNTRQTITAVSPQVPAPVQIGMTLAQALAHDTHLRHAPANPIQDQRALEALGRWLMRFSPNVALDPPASIFLDAAGLDRLFGDAASLCQRVKDDLARLQIGAAVAAAPTPGAAWALASVLAGGWDLAPVAAGGPEEIFSALGPLPPDALRLDSPVTQQLWGLGLSMVQLLLAVPRLQLARRFGPGILRRLDQVGGIEPEPLAWLPHRTPIVAEVEFDGAVESLEVILLSLRQLLERIAAELTHRQQGARQLQITFRRPYAPPLEKTIHLTRPNRDPAAMFKLLEVATESLETEDGFVSIQLAAPRPQRLGHRQRALVGDEAHDRSAAVDHLIERLAARLGDGSSATAGVEWAEPVEAHVPEKAYRCGGNLNAETRKENPKSETRNPKQIRMTKIRNKAQTSAPSPSTLGEASGIGDCPRAGRGEGDFERTTVLDIQNHPHPFAGSRRIRSRLPDYRESKPEPQNRESFTIRISDLGFDSDFGFRISDFFSPSDFPTRPLTLLQMPREIAVTLRPSDRPGAQPVAFTDQGQVHRLSTVAGPERIAGQWWNGHWKTRDYYDVQDETGRRHWVFRVAETRRWYLHGMFA